MPSIDKTIKDTFEKHGVNNKELEGALIDIFKRYEDIIISDRFVEKIFKEKERIEERRRAAWGG